MSSSKTDLLKSTLAKLPDSPGVYRFFNEDNTIIYVGKAKSLKKRVTSYFNKQSQYNRKTEKLVSEIKSIEFTLAETEFDALLLENNFIKQYQPKYNILLKDDKSFPFLCILNERFPRLISTRKFIPGSGEYFGPYTSVVSMNNVLDLIRQLYTIRTCSFDLSKENIEKKKFKVCLEFHLGNCLGPCEGKQDEPSYNKEISLARMILKGNLKAVLEFFKTEMQQAARALQFEKAGELKYKLGLVDRFQTSSMVVNKKLTDIDVITIVSSRATITSRATALSGGTTKSSPLRIKIHCQQKMMAIVLMGSFKIRKEYWAKTDAINVKSVSVTIQPYKIQFKSKQKTI